MKGLACARCMDLRALPATDLMQAWWVDGRRGIARFHASDQSTAFALGLCNTYLVAAMTLPHDKMTNVAWRNLHDDAIDADGYLFDKSNRACWALLFRPGTSSDTAWATPQEWEEAHL